uniref:Neuropeptide-like protein 31 n=1 Tax=Heterorhabditis bacteriophora TaxID=37862 RepID=A0A1I7WL20_HETBA
MKLLAIILLVNLSLALCYLTGHISNARVKRQYVYGYPYGGLGLGGYPYGMNYPYGYGGYGYGSSYGLLSPYGGYYG